MNARPALLAVCLAAVITAAAAGQTTRPGRVPDDPRYGLLTPLPERGGVPPIVDMLGAPTDQQLALRARARGYAKQIRAIRHRHFGERRVPELRAEGIRQIREFTDPAAFRPLIEELARENDDVRLALLDHLAGQGDDGQAALACVAITDESRAMRSEATNRMVSPPSEPVLRVLDQALRSPRHETANSAGALAGTLGALQTIPLLIFAQATRDPHPQDEGDLAWIAIETQHAYVANLQPVVGGNSGAFQPIMGVVHEGIVLRVMDAVVIVYRTEIHLALVSMTSYDWGKSTEHLGYDMKAWWQWYNTEYVTHKNEQTRRAGLEGGGAGGAPGAPSGGS